MHTTNVSESCPIYSHPPQCFRPILHPHSSLENLMRLKVS